MVMQALILVGGKGTRLGALTQTCPKPMMPIGETPFIEYIIRHLARFGIRDIILLAGYLGQEVMDTYQGRRFGNAMVRVIVEPQPAGTGGALRYAADILEDHFLLLNGDSFFDFNLLDLVMRYKKTSSMGCMALRAVNDASQYGKVTVENAKITAFIEKSASAGAAYINGGVYVLHRSILDWIGQAAQVSLERDVFPQITAAGGLFGYPFDGLFIDIGTPNDLRWAQQHLASRLQRPAVFLDRDGVINQDNGYVHRPEDFEWMPGAKLAIKRLNDAGYLVFVTTNQAGVARGYYSEAAVNALHAWLQNELHVAGAHVDAFYFCPHHVDAVLPQYKKDCCCRKPNPGMLQRALQEWDVDISRSFLIGDKASDLQAAEALDIPAHLYEGSPLDEFCTDILVSAKLSQTIDH